MSCTYLLSHQSSSLPRVAFRLFYKSLARLRNASHLSHVTHRNKLHVLIEPPALASQIKIQAVRFGTFRCGRKVKPFLECNNPRFLMYTIQLQQFMARW